jgi:hypothetical protein
MLQAAKACLHHCRLAESACAQPDGCLQLTQRARAAPARARTGNDQDHDRTWPRSRGSCGTSKGKGPSSSRSSSGARESCPGTGCSAVVSPRAATAHTRLPDESDRAAADEGPARTLQRGGPTKWSCKQFKVCTVLEYRPLRAPLLCTEQYDYLNEHICELALDSDTCLCQVVMLSCSFQS